MDSMRRVSLVSALERVMDADIGGNQIAVFHRRSDVLVTLVIDYGELTVQ